MGQQQLLLVILGIIIIGIAIAVGLNLFRTQSIDNKRDLLINESSSMAALAMSYYKKPGNLGGGGNSFIGWSIPNDMHITASGSFAAQVFSDSIIITGTGNEVVTGSDSVKIKTTVYPTNYVSVALN